MKISKFEEATTRRTEGSTLGGADEEVWNFHQFNHSYLRNAVLDTIFYGLR